jgi:hypothetical protein
MSRDLNLEDEVINLRAYFGEIGADLMIQVM